MSKKIERMPLWVKGLFVLGCMLACVLSITLTIHAGEMDYVNIPGAYTVETGTDASGESHTFHCYEVDGYILKIGKWSSVLYEVLPSANASGSLTLLEEYGINNILDKAFVGSGLTTLSLEQKGVANWIEGDGGYSAYGVLPECPTLTRLNIISDDYYSGSIIYKATNHVKEHGDLPYTVYVDKKNGLYKDHGYIVSIRDGALSLLASTDNAGPTFDFPTSLFQIESVSGFTNQKNLKTITIPKGVTRLDSSYVYTQNPEEDAHLGAFEGCCALTKVTLPSTITSMGTETFKDCTALKTITMPSKLEVYNLGADVFDGCSVLTKVTFTKGYENFMSWYYYGNTPATIYFTDKSYLSTIRGYRCKVTDGALESVEPTSAAATSFSVPDGLTGIRWGAFSNCTKLKKVTIPKSVLQIDYGVFNGCKALKTINYPDTNKKYRQCGWLEGCKASVTYSSKAHLYYHDGYYVYVNNGTLSSIEYTQNVTKNLNIPDTWGITKIARNTLKYAWGVTPPNGKLTIPKGVTSIGDFAFYGGAYTSLSLPTTLRTIGNHAFTGNAFKSVTIPDKVTKIDEYAFSECKKLTTVTMPSAPKTLGNRIFSDDAALKTVKVKKLTELYQLTNWIGSSGRPTLVVPKKSLVYMYDAKLRGDMGVSSSTAVSINEATQLLLPGDHQYVFLNNIGTAKVSYKSSDKSVATVDATGKVSAKKAGKSTITVTYKNKKYTCKVTVLSPTQANRAKMLYRQYHFDKLSDYHVAKATFLWMQYHCSYDYSFSRHDGKYIMLERLGVCQSYMEAFNYLMGKYNIPSEEVISWNMNHGWNLVKIGKSWYHLDATWGDFLMSDKQIQSPDSGQGAGLPKAGHYDYTAGHKCTSTKYDMTYTSKRKNL